MARAFIKNWYALLLWINILLLKINLKMRHLEFFLILVLILACDRNEADRISFNDPIQGTGAFQFKVNQSNLSTIINVFYHIPEGNVENMPVLIALHGAGRNAREMRNAWISESDAKGFIVVAPEFTEESFPGGNGYILGNVFLDSNNPTPESLNPEPNWTFSLIEPIFDEFKSQSENQTSRYNLYGFSAGAQFAHRFIQFKPNARVDKVLASAAGWYTIPDVSIDFPYGFGISPLESISLASLFSKALILQIGSLDNNPNEAVLRRNETVDEQGNNRYDRAFYMYNTSKSIAEDLDTNFNWEIIETQNNDHSLEPSVSQASDVLY
jgi:hypothetical protein